MIVESPGIATRILFGTEEPPEPLRRLEAGRLSVDLAGAALRAICWEGIEILRGIAFVVRDAHWGTYRLEIEDLAIEAHHDGFAVTFRATCGGPDGKFGFVADIKGHADGRLSYRAQGGSPGGFSTNRTGFVVLHALEGTVGRPMRVTHTDGRVEETRFPDAVQPHQPVFDIAQLAHTPSDDLDVTVRFEGDTFEMEDHRNWTDASFKTYVRPLALPFPYRLSAGEVLRQSVHLTVVGHASPVQGDPAGPIAVMVGGSTGTVLPRLGLFADAEVLSALGETPRACPKLNAGYLQVRLDMRAESARDQLRAARELAATLNCPMQLDAIVAALDPEAEVREIADDLAVVGSNPEALFIIPGRGLHSEGPRGEAPVADLLAAARRRLPGLFLYAGAPTHFTELNRIRPPAGCDGIANATAATVHAADDLSVMETLEALPHVVRSARVIAGAAPYRIGPAGIGMVQSASNSRLTANPERRRQTQVSADPRQAGLFAAAFMVGYVAGAEGTEALTLAAPTGTLGLLEDDGRPRPAAFAFAGLAELADCPRLVVQHDARNRIAAVGAETREGPVVWLANLTIMPQRVVLVGSTFNDAEMLSIEGRSSGALDPGSLDLPPYAVARVSGRA